MSMGFYNFALIYEMKEKYTDCLICLENAHWFASYFVKNENLVNAIDIAMKYVRTTHDQRIQHEKNRQLQKGEQLRELMKSFEDIEYNQDIFYQIINKYPELLEEDEKIVKNEMSEFDKEKRERDYR